MVNNKYDYDAIVVGAGPNGLAAAILLQQHGLSVLLLEGKNTIGGGLRTAELTLPHFLHDVCSAIHPMAAASPFLQSLPLEQFGLEYITPEVNAAHPFDNGKAAILKHSLNETATLLGRDEEAYRRLIEPIVKTWPRMATDVLAPLHIPKHPIDMAAFGLKALQPATLLKNRFVSEEAKGLFAGMAAHAIQPLSNLASSAIALVLLANGHLKNWPLPKGGSQQIALAMGAYFTSLGGKIETGNYISSLNQLPSAKAVLFDVTPKQLLAIADSHFSSLYRYRMQRYRYGMGVFKIDWALDGAIPFMAEECRRAGTIHLGGTFAQIAQSESITAKGGHPEEPFVLLAQPSVFDSSRAPSGLHTAWAYCHVPNGSKKDMTTAIENQVERFAPGFKKKILAKSTMNTAQVEAYNPNYIGGDINGGILDITQLYSRPLLQWSPYRTSVKGMYICSSSTPPGGGVHGMCGYHAAKQALKDVFHIKPNRI